MLLKGFNTPEAAALLEELPTDPNKLRDLVSCTRQLTYDNDTLSYSLPGLPLCWKCTLKHTGQAVGFAAEVEAYPERIACVVGELGHAYRECPDKAVAAKIRETYQGILDTGCIPDMTPLLKEVVTGWRDSLS